MIKKRITDENLPFDVKKYFKKYGEDKWELELSDDRSFKTAIVIPSIAEFENIPALLTSLCENEKTYFNDTIVIFSINNLPNADQIIKDNNKKSIELVRNIINKVRTDQTESIIDSGLNFGLVDLSSEGREMPIKDGGVGVARKTGMDLALTVFSYKGNSSNLLVCLDGDCTVSDNYISEIRSEFDKRKHSVAYVNFHHTHTGSEEEQLAIICYEIFLRYYVLGLRSANSPYGFHTIGSTMICDSTSYIKIQGMNKRKAAEDFYFMEKLAKNVKIESIKNAVVFPSGRGSWRVPFGTGQRVNRYLSKEQDEYQLYNPKAFIILKKWLDIFNSDEILSADEYLKLAESVEPVVKKFLVEQSFEKAWNKILHNSGKAEQIYKQKILWFDGFRTLKFIHFLRDNGFPNINMFEALDQQFKNMNLEIDIKRIEDIPEKSIQIEYLKLLRRWA